MSTDSSYRKSVVLHIITGLSTGGAERMLCNLLSRINRMRFEPVVVSLMDRGTLGDRIEALGIPVHTIGIKQGMPTPAAMWRLIQIVRQLKPDLIQGWMYHGNLAAQFASFFFTQKFPVLWGIHHSISSLNSEKKTSIAVIRLGALLSKVTSNIVFVSQTSKVQHEALGYCNNNSCVIPNGFDTSLFIPSREARLTVRSELGLPEDIFLIGLFGRYHPMKDHANFLQAAALLSKHRPDLHFILVGTEVNRENQNLYQLIQKLGISTHIHLLGERSDMPRLSAALDIASSSSAYGEAFPLVVGEAMSCGVPCVVTDVGDSGWIVGNTGRVVPPRNPEALANAWKELLHLGLEGRETLGRAARERIIASFALDSVVAQYETLYENLL
jgi:glycosyltransferase involved in cell wall biosynthesis